MMVDVTYADREAAGFWIARNSACDFSTPEESDMLESALAAHRIQSTADLQAKLDMAVEALQEVDDTLAKLSGSLAEIDAALLAQEISVIALERENIAPLITAKSERDE